jgi:di/tricarboxylate transporter
MNIVTSLFRDVFRGGVKLAKSLTFWSIIIGIFIFWDTSIGIGLYNLFNEQGLEAAFKSSHYKLFVFLTGFVLILLVVFYFMERDQNTVKQKEADKIKDELKDMSKNLDLMIIAINKMIIAINKSTENLDKLVKTAYRQESIPSKSSNQTNYKQSPCYTTNQTDKQPVFEDWK